MSPITLHSPAKLNLFLAITGRRADGFHDLVSVATPVVFGDTLTVEPSAKGFALSCNEPELDTGEANLIMRAARAYAAATGWAGGARFLLEKRIPMGAGLGGGSSNATTALVALNQLAGGLLSRVDLGRIAVRLGSDCALFLQEGPVVMRGRGEHVEALPAEAAARLSGRRVLIFKPAFGINTGWAYGRMAAQAPDSYLSSREAEIRLCNWIDKRGADAGGLLYNNMEAPAFEKYIALPVALERLREVHGLAPRMSGSGSACFALLAETAVVADIAETLRGLWGRECFVTDTRLV